MRSRIEAFRVSILLSAVLMGLTGCGRGGPKTYPAHGKLEVIGGDVRQLAGSHVEIALANNPTHRAAGVIRDDGSFVLETLHSGSPSAGAQAGAYLVRVVLNDDDPAGRRRSSQTIAARFLDFQASGLTLEVPSSGPIILQAAAR